ncbi:MAG: hypothetical protein ABSE22_01935 [Xanthobacteraceae bacterium]|jgi:hypothetical protein
MADYYPVLARAVSRLADNSVPARRELYEHARTIIDEQFPSRDRGELTAQAVDERAALELAIRKVEAETRSSQTRSNGGPAPTRAPTPRAGTADAKPRSKATASSLAKILQALQAEETRGGGPATTDLVPMNGTTPARPSVLPGTTVGSSNRISNASAELEDVPHSLGTMFFGIAYIAAAMAFTGVTYIRAAVWMYRGVIGYPTLLIVMAITLALFIIPPIAIFRKSSGLPSAGPLLRFIHAASRRVL